MSLQRILELAEEQIGIKEKPLNSNNVKYNTWFYGQEVRDGFNLKGLPDKNAKYPWCGSVVSYIFHFAEHSLGSIDYLRGFAGCPYAVRNLKKWGRLVTIPRPTDIVFYDFDGNGIFDHTGIFSKDLGKGLFQTYEGNTSFGNNSNGGEFMKRSDRKYKNAIFVRPKVLETLI